MDQAERATESFPAPEHRLADPPPPPAHCIHPGYPRFQTQKHRKTHSTEDSKPPPKGVVRTKGALATLRRGLDGGRTELEK